MLPVFSEVSLAARTLPIL